DHQLELHTEAYLLRVADGQTPLDPHLVVELDEADAERAKRLLRLAASVGLLRQELLRGPGPQRPAAREQALAHRRRSAARARRGFGDRAGAPRLTATADQTRLVGRPGEHTVGEGNLPHEGLPGRSRIAFTGPGGR